MKKYLIVIVLIMVSVVGGYSTAYIVNSSADAGAGAGASGDLRYCIQQSSGAAGPHTISFSLAVGTVITLNSDLQINNATNQNGLSIDASNGTNPGIVLRRNGGATGIGIDIGWDVRNVSIKGLVFQNFDNGIRFSGPCNGGLVRNCFFGTNLNGSSISGNVIMKSGIYLSNSCTAITIGGNNPGDRNVLSGCMFVGIGDATRYGAIKMDNNSSGNFITGNYIGTDVTGLTGLGNGNTAAGNIQPGNHHGILFTNNSSSGTVTNNVISASQGTGVYSENGSSSHTLKGNKIGTDINGMQPLPNLATGVYMDGGSNILIGGITAAERNIISGNRGANDSRPCRAVYCGAPATGPTTFDNTLICGIYFKNVTNSNIRGNYIGTDATGISTGTGNNMGNLYAGIKIEGNSNNNTIGGPDTRYRNIIGGNGYDFNPSNSYVGHGILLGGIAGTNTIFVYNNFVGIGQDGSTTIGNRQDGVSLQGASNCTIGDAGKGNVLSDNGWGIFMQSDFSNNALSNQCTGNKIFGNLIGTDSTGLLARGNGVNPVHALDGGGIGMQHKSSTNQIGNTGAGQGNVISGNIVGIMFKVSSGGAFGSAPNANTVYNNIIGLDKNGVNAIPNTGSGPDLGCGIVFNEGANNNTIGGTGANQRNIISGNDQNGVRAFNATKGTYSNTISGNYIGLASDGVTDKGNGQNGIYIEMVNGTIITSNVVSGNTQMGIFINNSNASVINSNKVGTDAAASVAVKNDQHGIFINNGSQNNTIGAAGNGNTVSGNGIHGILILGMTTTGNTVAANYIGISASNTVIPNLVHGVVLDGTTGNTVGTVGAGNIISGNITGILINNSTNNNVYANYVGTNVAGSAKIPNTDNGILLDNASTGNNIGGSVAGQGNVVSGNAHMGVKMVGSANNFVRNNFIGTDANGNADLGNGWHGLDLSSNGATNSDNIVITNNVISGNGDFGTAALGNGISASSASNLTVTGNFLGTNAAGTVAISNHLAGFSCSNSNNNIIGGTTAAARNIISGNGDPGMYMNNSDGSTIRGNYIGTAANGSTNLGNTSSGIYMENGCNNNIIGGLVAGATNNIAYNGVNGIVVADASSFNNSINQNSIFCNVRRGIELNGLGNNNFAKPVILGTSTSIVLNGTAPVNSYVEVFTVGAAACKTCGASGTVNDSIQGRIYVATVQADASGNWTYNNGVSFTADVTATASSNNTGNYNTSEFSTCRVLCIAAVAPSSITISSGKSICSDLAGNITMTANGGTTSDPVEWYTGSCLGTLAFTGNPYVITVPPVGVNKYYVRRTNGCGNSTCYLDSITVHAAPVAPTSASAGTSSFCSGTTGPPVSLNATGGSGENLVWYQTTCGTGTVVTSPVAIPTSTTDYFARWESAACTPSNCAQATITIVPSPSVSLPSSSSICQDSLRTFSTGTPTADTYNWVFTTTGTGSITSGQGTNSVTINAGTANGTLTLKQTNAASCSTIVAVPVSLQTPGGTTALAGADKSICAASLQLAANNTAGTWSIYAGTGTFSPNAFTYNASVSGLSNGLNKFIWTTTGTCGFVSKDTVALNVGASGLIAKATTSSDTACFGSPKDIGVLVSGSGSGNYTYLWTSSDNSFNLSTSTANVTVNPVSTTTVYYLNIVDNVNTGCNSGDSVKVFALADQHLVVPNLVTPNGDEKNDYLDIKDENNMKILPGSSIEIVNRWGERVYKNSSYDNSWNAPNLSDGVYYYYINSGCGNRVYKGWIQIIH